MNIFPYFPYGDGVVVEASPFQFKDETSVLIKQGMKLYKVVAVGSNPLHPGIEPGDFIGVKEGNFFDINIGDGKAYAQCNGFQVIGFVKGCDEELLEPVTRLESKIIN